MYPASGAVGPEAPEGTTELVGRLRKVRGGTGEPSDGRRCGVWVVHQRRRRRNSQASHVGAYCTRSAFNRRWGSRPPKRAISRRNVRCAVCEVLCSVRGGADEGCAGGKQHSLCAPEE